MRPGYETLDSTGAGRPIETMAASRRTRPAADIGRYGRRTPAPRRDATARPGWQDELMQMRTRLAELGA
jgi:hypothetical protein